MDGVDGATNSNKKGNVFQMGVIPPPPKKESFTERSVVNSYARLSANRKLGVLTSLKSAGQRCFTLG